jgi:hypothetical protein
MPPASVSMLDRPADGSRAYPGWVCDLNAVHVDRVGGCSGTDQSVRCGPIDSRPTSRHAQPCGSSVSQHALQHGQRPVARSCPFGARVFGASVRTSERHAGQRREVMSRCPSQGRLRGDRPGSGARHPCQVPRYGSQNALSGRLRWAPGTPSSLSTFARLTVRLISGWMRSNSIREPT